MLFNSAEFIFLFLPVSLLIYSLLRSHHGRGRSVAWLVAVSLFFYGWWDFFLVILLGFSILCNYALALRINAREKNLPTLWLGIIFNLGILGYYKYTNFIVNNVGAFFDLKGSLPAITYPVAISFITFQQISYLVDRYRGEIKEHSFPNYCLYAMFFPKLISGPIVRYKELLPQLSDDTLSKIEINDICVGVTLFIIGLFKKAVLADGITRYATPVFASADSGSVISFFEGWGGACAYSLQIYFDFSGYTDMATGVARMFGIRLPLNFNSPYKSLNMIDFWRRWHISLSRFLRDYIYIPLGGNRLGINRRNLNIMATMLLAGIWHGAGWNYVIWGGLHGFYIVVNYMTRLFRFSFLKQDLDKSSIAGRLFSRIITLFSVTIAWVFFRAQTYKGAIEMLNGMLGKNGILIPAKYSNLIPHFLRDHIGLAPGPGIGSFTEIQGVVWIALLYLIALVMPNSQEFLVKHKPVYENISGSKNRLIWNQSAIWAFAMALLLFLSLKILFYSPDSQFIYFKF